MPKNIFACAVPISGLVMFWGGCDMLVSPNWDVTGQVNYSQTDQYGDLTEPEADHPIVTVTKGDTFSIILGSVFVRSVKEAGGSEFLVYAEVREGPDIRSTYTRILFNERNQSAGYLLNLRNKPIIGPIAFNGKPVTIRFYVVELDKQENEITKNIIKTAAELLAVAQPQTAPFSGMAVSFGDLLSELNPDDREMDFELTLYPAEMNVGGATLQTGSIAMIKTEHRKRAEFSILNFGQDREKYFRDPRNYKSPGAGKVYDENGVVIDKAYENYAEFFAYDDGEIEGDSGNDGPITKWRALRALGGELRLQTVMLEYNGKIILADPRVVDAPDIDVAGAAEEGVLEGDHFEISRYRIGSREYQELALYRDGEGAEEREALQAVRLSEHFPYREKTHAVLRIATGGELVDRSVLETMAEEDRQALSGALQTQPTLEATQNRLEELRGAILHAATRRSLINAVNKSLAGHPEARTSVRFPQAYLARLNDRIPAENEVGHDAVIAKNKVIIEILQSMIEGFDGVEADAEVGERMAELKKIKDRIEYKDAGLFVLTEGM